MESSTQKFNRGKNMESSTQKFNGEKLWRAQLKKRFNSGKTMESSTMSCVLQAFLALCIATGLLNVRSFDQDVDHHHRDHAECVVDLV